MSNISRHDDDVLEYIVDMLQQLAEIAEGRDLKPLSDAISLIATAHKSASIDYRSYMPRIPYGGHDVAARG